MLGIVQCDREKTGKVPWSLHFIDGADISQKWVVRAEGLQCVMPRR